MENQQTGNRPVPFRDGRVVVKVWKDRNSDGQPFFSTTIGRTWQDEQGQYHESRNLSRIDLLKLPNLLADAGQYIRNQERRMKAQEQQAEHPELQLEQTSAPDDVGDLLAQRDAALSKAVEPTRSSEQPRSRGPER